MNQPSKKPLLIVLGAHEPTADPREKWVCDMATSEYEIQFLGIQEAPARLPTVEQWDSYSVHRLIRKAEVDTYIIDQLASLTAGEEKVYWAEVWPATIRRLQRIDNFYRRVVIALPKRLYILSRVIYYRSLPYYYQWKAKLGLEGLGNRLRFGKINRRQVTSEHAINDAASLSAPTFSQRYVAWVERNVMRWENRTEALYLFNFRPSFQFSRFKWLVIHHYINCNSLFIRHMESLDRKPAVVHCNDLETMLAGYWAKLKYGSKLIYDSHEYFSYSDIDAAQYHVKFFQKLERLLAHRSDAVVTVNSVLAEEIRQDYDLPVVVSVPNAEPWIEQRPSPRAPEITSLGRGRVSFLFQGNFAPDRGLRELIEGWRFVDGAKAALFLRGSANEWRTEIQKLASRYGVLDKSVYILEPVPVADLVEGASEADVGIIPYRPIHRGYRFCCPNKLSQYLHAGMMIVSNDLPYVRMVLDESSSGLYYEDANPRSIAETIMKVAESAELRQACRANAIKYAESVFNWQNFGPTFLDLYRAGILGVSDSTRSPVRRRLIYAKSPGRD